MRYLLAIICPPVAVLLCDKPRGTVLLNVLLWALGLIPGIIHALVVVRSHNVDPSTREMECLIGKSVAGVDAVKIMREVESLLAEGIDAVIDKAFLGKR